MSAPAPVGSSAVALPAAATSAIAWADAAEPLEAGDSEQALMDRLRHADPATVVRLARDLRHRFRRGAFADERDSREVDALLALGKIQAAHYRAQLFVQHYPDSPYATHVMSLMGVHPRPPGVVPEPVDERGGN